MEIFGIPSDILNMISTFGFGGVVIIMLAFAGIKKFADTNKDKAKDDAEASLYQNLSAENARMSQMLGTMTTQLNILLKDNQALLQRVTALEGSVRELSVWETKALALQEEMIKKEKIISDLNLKIAQQELLINKIDTRKP
jgi:hypothetical protein